MRNKCERLISQANIMYASMPDRNREETVLELGEILYEIRQCLGSSWISQIENILSFSGRTARRYCRVFELANPGLCIYKSPVVREKKRNVYNILHMGKDEFLDFYIAYLILKGKNNQEIKEAILNVWAKEQMVDLGKIKGIRDFISSKKYTDTGEKPVLYAIACYRKTKIGKEAFL